VHSVFPNALYLAPVRPKLEYASTVWNSIAPTDAKNLKSVQRKFVDLCQYRFFTYDHVTYRDSLIFLELHTLQNRRLYLDAAFFISVYSILKRGPSVFGGGGGGITDIRVIPLISETSPQFSATFKNFPSTICVPAATRVCAKTLTCLGNPLLH
jgi:hypothetical protein